VLPHGIIRCTFTALISPGTATPKARPSLLLQAGALRSDLRQAGLTR